MAKKARRKLDEPDETQTFRFPEFDVKSFLTHEFEQTSATFWVIGIALLLGAVCWAMDRAIGGASQLGFIPPLLGLFGIIVTPLIIGRVRPASGEYTKGDWAGLIALELFAWLGLWFTLLNVFPV